MSTSALPRGRATSLAWVPETSYGVPATPSANYITRHAYAPVNLNRSNSPQDEQVLGAGLQNDFDDQTAGPDIESADVSVAWCFDLVEVGYILRELFGAPATTGTTPKTHVFTSGAATLPTGALEQKRAASLFKMAKGLVPKKVVFSGGSAKGYAQIPVDYVCRQVTASYASALADPAVTQPAFSQRVPNSTGQLLLAGARPGRILKWTLTLEPQLILDSYDGDSFAVSDVAVDGYKASLAIDARFSNGALEAYGDIAAGQVLPAAYAAELDYVFDSNNQLKIALPAVRFAAVNAPIQGGGAVTISLAGRAEATVSAAMVTATLKNAWAGYA